MTTYKDIQLAFQESLEPFQKRNNIAQKIAIDLTRSLTKQGDFPKGVLCPYPSNRQGWNSSEKFDPWAAIKFNEKINGWEFSIIIDVKALNSLDVHLPIRIEFEIYIDEDKRTIKLLDPSKLQKTFSGEIDKESEIKMIDNLAREILQIICDRFYENKSSTPSFGFDTIN